MTPWLNFINILQAAFKRQSVYAKFTGVQSRAQSVEVEHIFLLFVLAK
jgi:hypothetical protein